MRLAKTWATTVPIWRTRTAHRVARIITVARIDCIVQDCGLFLILPLYSRKPALPAKPLANQADQIDPPRIRRVEHRFVLGKQPVVEHRMLIFGHPGDQIVANDNQRNTARADIFLGTRIDERVF